MEGISDKVHSLRGQLKHSTFIKVKTWEIKISKSN